MSIQRYAMTGYDDADAWLAPDDDGIWVTYGDHQAAVAEADVEMMDLISRAIADGHRGNGSYEWDICCQVCQEIECDPDCAVAVSRQAVSECRKRTLDEVQSALDSLATDMANWSSSETNAAVSVFPDLSFDQWMWAQRGAARALEVINSLRVTSNPDP